MFEDGRSKKIVLIAHCILNQNSISDGTALFPGINESILNILVNSKVGILQLPCPELNCLGLLRGDIHGSERYVIHENTRIREEMQKSIPEKIMNNLVNDIIYQITEYINNGFEIPLIIGINRSPSCGVDITSKNNEEVSGEGVFVEKLKCELKRINIDIPFVGVKGELTESDEIKIKKLLKI